jgi:hypothetical protein
MGVDKLTNERRQTSNPMFPIYAPPLLHRSKIDAHRFETVDASRGSSNGVRPPHEQKRSAAQIWLI